MLVLHAPALTRPPQRCARNAPATLLGPEAKVTAVSLIHPLRTSLSLAPKKSERIPLAVGNVLRLTCQHSRGRYTVAILAPKGWPVQIMTASRSTTSVLD